MPSCASAAKALKAHYFFGISVGFRLIQINLGIESLFCRPRA